MRLTQFRVVGSGSTIETYEYKDHPLAYDFQIVGNKSRERIKVVDEQSRLRKIESRKRSLQRTRTNLRRLVNANAWMWKKPRGKYYLPTFATFTFKEEEFKNVKVGYWHFSAFIKRLNEYVHGERKNILRYVVVPEFQERGTVHFHAVFFNLPYVLNDSLEVIWGNGMVKIKAIRHVDNVGAYITKYMSKEFEDDRLDGLKHYSSSRGLIRPTEVRNEITAKRIIERIPKKYLANEKEFESQHQGKVLYRQFKLGKHTSIDDFMLKSTSV